MAFPFRRLLQAPQRHPLTSIQRFIVLFSILLLFSLVLILYVQNRTYGMIEEDAQERNLLLLEQTKQMVDRYIVDVQALSHRLALDSSIADFLKMEPLPLGSERLQNIIDTSESISNYAFQNPFIKQVLVYSQKNGYIVSTDRTYLNPELTYGSLWKVPDLSYEQWKNQYMTPHHRNAYLSAREMVQEGVVSRAIPFLQSLPLEYSKLNLGKLMILLDESIILKIMQNLELGANGYAGIFGADETELVRFMPKGSNALPGAYTVEAAKKLAAGRGTVSIKMDGRAYIITSTISTVTGWHFYSLLPVRDLKSKISFIFRAYSFLSLGFLVLIGIAALVFSWKEAQSWKAIKQVLSSYDNLIVSKNDFDSVRLSINGLMENNQIMLNFQKEQRPEMQKILLQRLLYGKMKDLQELKAMENYLSLDVSGSEYGIFIVKIALYEDLIDEETLQTLDFYRLFLQKTMNDVFYNRYISLEEDPGQIVYLTWWKNKDAGDAGDAGESAAAELDTVLNRVHKDLQASGQTDYFIAAGRITAAFMDIPLSYVDAKEVLKHQTLQGQAGYLRTKDLPDYASMYYFPLDLENRLYTLIQGGESEKACAVVHDLFRENIDHRKISPDMMEQFLTVLKGTILRVGSKEADENLESLEKISAASGLSKEGIEQHIYEVLRGIAKEKHRRGHKDQLKTSLEQYISANFVDANLNLSILADHFKLKESYIYFFFKNYMGTSFSGYLADIRLRKAITILTKDDRDIGEIAEAVGYANVQTFRRAFKKGTGLTPTEYRDAKREFTA